MFENVIRVNKFIYSEMCFSQFKRMLQEVGDKMTTILSEGVFFF